MGGTPKSIIDTIKLLLRDRPNEWLTFVFDALDECKDYDGLLEHLADLWHEHPGLSLFFSARDGVQIGSHFPCHEALITDDRNTYDIDTYIDSEVSKRYERVGMQHEQAERLKKALKRLAGGM